MASLDTPRRITEQDAVNIMLAQIGEAPVAALGPTAKATAQRATDRLAEESIRIQSDNYNSFKARKLTLTRDPGNGHITLPYNILSWHPVDTSWDEKLTEDDGKLYDTEANTFVFDRDILIEAVLARPFDTLSQPARWFITCAAAIHFANTENPGGQYLRVTAEKLEQAKAAFEKYDRRLLQGGLRVHNPYFRRMRGWR